ncbi:MAG: class I SAM-dependent methyltransferase [Bacteroidota bacterium]
MQLKLFFIRKIKVLFARWNLHIIVKPFTGFLLKIAYLSKFSEWRAKHSNLSFNDFYSSKWNYNKRYSLYEYVLTHEKLDGAINYLEFGVSEGHSFRWWMEHNKDANSTFHGFDTFTGLPEDWNVFKEGAMSTEGKTPDVNDSRATFVKGLFQDTLPKFLKEFFYDKSKLTAGNRKVIHLDADLYTSTLYVLTSFASFLKAGDILLFDEFVVPHHEFLAFENFTSSYRINYEVIGAANNYYFLAIKIK